MTDPLNEHVAEAIAAADGCRIAPDTPWPWAQRSEAARQRYRMMATAALDAIAACREEGAL